MNLGIKKYKKKPIVVEAYEITQELLDNVEASPIESVYFYSDHVEVETLEGRMNGVVGSFVIKGIEGEQYVCERNIFFKTYEDISNFINDRIDENKNFGENPFGSPRKPVEYYDSTT
jgi:hypothetical protein